MHVNVTRNLSNLLRTIKHFSTKESRSIGDQITEILNQNFNPKLLKVINESHMHNVPKGSETHFRVCVVSHKFENQSLINRHRMVQNLLADYMKNGPIHALSIETLTPAQMEKEGIKNTQSPQCRGGGAKR
ncbi:hypothetical protein LAZ67_17000258 [Cordylochernes scorpioides]|uniref:BolA-like protein n=1 Tax=Cordylochernes scorpioides TaxID=51811 RepID=A0ABY6LFD0_9ARAC|nr:hypothetical protein LAZ67_17000258 [Cordylochernes scorpioides]